MLDHLTLRTKDLEAAKALFETVLGLDVGYRPAFPFRGYWVYAAGQPVVHLISGRPGRSDRRDDLPGRLSPRRGRRRPAERYAYALDRDRQPTPVHKVMSSPLISISVQARSNAAPRVHTLVSRQGGRPAHDQLTGSMAAFDGAPLKPGDHVILSPREYANGCASRRVEQ
jgi:hypothetical protein